MMVLRRPKFRRDPDSHSNKRLTDTSLSILRLLASYQFLPTPLLIALSPASRNITCEHLALLYHRALVNRFSFPRLGNPGQFHYYLDSREALALLEMEAD